VAGAEFQNQDPILSCYHARDWCAKSIGLFSNGGTPFDPPGTPYMANIPGQPQNIVMGDRRQNQVSLTGVIYNNTPGATTALQANADGTDVVPFAIGQYGTLSPVQNEIGGDGRSIYDGLTLVPESERSNFLVSMSYDFSDSLSGFFDVSFANVLGVNVQEGAAGFGSDSVNACIRDDNAFLAGNPGLQTAVLNAAGNGGFFACFDPFLPPRTTVRKDFTQEIDQIVNTDSDTTRVVFGLQGDIGESSWSWDAYYQYGKTDREQIGYDYRSSSRILMAIDAIIDPRPGLPTTGQPVCRVTVTGVAPPLVNPSLMEGCVPLNVFGLDGMSAEARAYAFAPIVEFNRIKQQLVAGSVSGELWKGWSAGPLVGAAGLEFRTEELLNEVGDEEDDARRVDIVAQYGDDFGGEVDVSEAFVELEMPLLADRPGAQLLSVNAAYREARYKTTDLVRDGGTSTQDISMWKFSAIWDPTSWLRIRGSQSQDIRAAGFRELYWSLTQPAGPDIFGQVANPWIPGGFPFNQDPRTLNLRGNVNLKPEEAKTTTFGFVLTPGGAAERLRFSADYYRIKLKDGIQGGIEPRILSSCYNTGNPEDCALIQGQNPTTGPGGPGWLDIVSVDAPYFNARAYEADGIDTSVDYTVPLSNGTISLRLLSTHALETVVTSPPIAVGGPDTVRDIAGQTGGDTGFFSDWAGSPEWVHNLVFSYFRGPFMITAQGQYHTSGIIDKQTPKTDPSQPGYDPNVTGSVSVNTTPSHFTLNLNGSYSFTWGRIEGMEVFASINNALDKDPPFASGATGGANPIFFPALGRTYRLGMRMRF
jgi:outer membrane receptor protein involved in Fe transport